MAASEMPAGAPYEVTVGEPVEIQVERTEDGILVAKFEFQGDDFGFSIDLNDLDAPEKVAVDELVGSLALLVWHEFAGTPVFREEDAKWTGRVEVSAPWLRQTRTPTKGYIANADAVADSVVVESMDQFEETFGELTVAAGTALESAGAGELVTVDLGTGDMKVSMTADEALAVARGEVPESFIARVNKSRPVTELLDEVEAGLGVSENGDDWKRLEAARRAVSELRRRASIRQPG